MPRPVAVITGPTSGIGAGYARRYASDGYDLVLVARDVDRLTQLAGELKSETGSIEMLPADLADRAGRDKVAERLAAGVRVLVNNAGTGTVINIASVAGMVPGRGSTYSASKAWVISFSEGLAVGLQGTGVGVHAVCPGYVHTEFHTRAGLDMAKLPSFLWLEVDDVVGQSLADVASGKVISIPGPQYKAIVTAGRMIPRGLMRALTKRVGGGRGRT
jgi:short-subunit dehydrogenase